MTDVAVLFARRDSIYKTLPGCDVYDIDRYARNYAGSLPIVAHPPCRAWSRMRAFAKPAIGEKELALFAVDQVRRCGGVLEHPAASSLWRVASLPPIGGGMDSAGGFSLGVSQCWWGHRAEKRTWLYIVGVDRAHVPPAPLRFVEPTHVCASSKKYCKLRAPPPRPALDKAERERTPHDFALFLLTIARLSAKQREEVQPYRPFQRTACGLSARSTAMPVDRDPVGVR